MALKRSLWIGAPLAAAAVLAVALLPPRPLSDRAGLLFGTVWYSEYSGLRSVLERNADVAADVLRSRVGNARRGDSLIALATRDRTALHSADGLVTVLYDPSLPADTARRLLAKAVRELELYPAVDGPGMRAIVAVYADSARHPDFRQAWWGRRSFTRESALGNACIVELNRTPRGQRYDRRSGAWLLNGCAVYVRFGPRGGGAPGWTARSAGILDDRFSWQGGLTDGLVQGRRQGPPRPASWEWRPSWTPSLFDSARTYFRQPVGWQWSACLVGSDSSCLGAAGLLRQRRSRWVGWWGNPFLRRSFTASLLASGDVPQFAAFWRSDLPYAQALERAYGKPAAEVVREVVSRQWSPLPHGPHITGRVVTAAIGWVVVALGLAMIAGRRRQARS